MSSETVGQPESCRVWLAKNGYSMIADTINEIMAEWSTAGKRTRRNWWAILAGDKRGRSRWVAGREFPILAEVRERQGLPPVVREVTAPAARPQARWTSRRPA